MRRFTSDSETATEDVGEQLGRELAPDGIVLLEGDLGSGKTVLVRGLGRALGVERREIQSPTYALIHEHEGERGRLVHVDLYRLDPEDADSLGLDELLAGPGVKALEWAERYPRRLAGLRVRLRAAGSGRREIFVDATNNPKE